MKHKLCSVCVCFNPPPPTAPDDYEALSMVDVTFTPSGPPVECVNITIIRDSLVEEAEVFFFTISANQSDEAVVVGALSRSFVLIADEEDGKFVPHPSLKVLYIPFPPLVLTAVVDRTAYEVEEAAGSLPVCVNISGPASLARPVNVQVMTIIGSAVGMSTHPSVLSVMLFLCLIYPA